MHRLQMKYLRRKPARNELLFLLQGAEGQNLKKGVDQLTSMEQLKEDLRAMFSSSARLSWSSRASFSEDASLSHLNTRPSLC